MIEINPRPADKRKLFSPRRVTLLASVAAIAIVAAAGASGAFNTSALPALTSPAQAADAAQAPSSFADLVAKVKPAVISVRVRIEESSNTDGNGHAAQFSDGSPMQRFFQQFGMPNGGMGGMGGMPQGKQIITGEGSGFFISADGYAVTNNHVVDHAENVQVTTDDGKTYKAKVIGTDPKTDVALIKVDAAGKTFPYVKFADQTPRVGDWVVAVGNPFGLGGTVTAGIVSARGRDIGSGPYDDYIQIDAPINKGNSGGPAFNTNGDVIGVNTAIFSPSGGSVGIGFDVPASTAKMVVAQLKAHGKVERAWLGVQVQPVTADIADSLGLKKAEGALVDQPQVNSPAATAGIAAGDVITEINGKPVKDSRELARTIGMMAPNTSVKLTLLHDRSVKTFDVTLGTMPSQKTAMATPSQESAPQNGVPHLGLALEPAADVAGAGGKGVVVVNVSPDGPAAERGFRAGDVILDVGGKAVANAADVRKAMSDAHASGKRDVLMRVKTAQAGTRFVAVPVGRA